MTRSRDLATSTSRHDSTASSGADSFKSTDTVRNIFGSHSRKDGSGGGRRGGAGVSVRTKDEGVGVDRYVLCCAVLCCVALIDFFLLLSGFLCVSGESLWCGQGTMEIGRVQDMGIFLI